jgi:cobalamin synthase
VVVRIVLNHLGGVCVTRLYEYSLIILVVFVVVRMVLIILVVFVVVRIVLDHFGGVCGGTNSLKSSL